MNDGINRIPPTRPIGYGPKASSNINRDKLQQDGVVEDRVEVDPGQRGPEPEKKEDISLSVATVRIVAQGNLDPDIEAALTAFAPLGDLIDADRLCDILEKRGVEFITWPPDLSLSQALEVAVAAS